MKSQQKKTLVKKPRQLNVSKKYPRDTNLGDYVGAGQPVYNIAGGSGTDTITLGVGDCMASETLTITNTADTITLDSFSFPPNSITIPTSVGIGPYSNTVNSTYNWVTGTTVSPVSIGTDGIDMQTGTDIKVGGKSLTQAIEKLEERLAILNPNPELEERWEQLKELRKKYMELEKDLLEKEKIMKILKEQ